MLAAVYQGRWPDQIARVIGLFGYSIPVFWLGLMGLLLFYAKLGWVGGPGPRRRRLPGFRHADHRHHLSSTPRWRASGRRSGMPGRHLILPSSVLGMLSVAYISRMTRSFMITELQQQYVIAARVKGLSEFRVVWRHALRNAFVPLVTVIALSYAHLLEGSVLTETIFAWPGLGRYITNSLLNADMNAVLGGTLVIGAVFIGVNLLSDILGRLFDPRTRMSAGMTTWTAYLITDSPDLAPPGAAWPSSIGNGSPSGAIRSPWSGLASSSRCCWSRPSRR